MTWTKLSDDFADDCWSLSDRAFRLHVEGLGWTNRKLLDCVISKADVRRFAKHPEAAEELVASGWWADQGADYRIRHHAGYQRLREQVIAQQAANQANGKKGGRPPKKPKPAPETQSVTESLSESKSKRDGTGLAKTGKQVEEEQQQQEQETKPSSWPCPEPDCTFVLTDKNKHLHDCRGYREERNVNRLSDDNWDDRFGASSVPWDPQPERRSA